MARLRLVEGFGAGYKRCINPIKDENVDAWFHPDPKNLGSTYATLEDPIDAFYQHESVDKGSDEVSE